MQDSVLHECQKLSPFAQVGRGEFLMQERHGNDLAESVMLSRIPDLMGHAKPA